MSDVIADLERLARLRDSGALTPEEFETRKAMLLATPTQCPHCRAPLQIDAAGRCAFCHAPITPTAVPPLVSGADATADAIVRAHPDNKIAAIKALRGTTTPPLDLKTAKDRIDAAFARVHGR